MSIETHLLIRTLGKDVPYQMAWDAMQQLTRERHTETLDEIWLLEHPAIFTLGRNAKPEHVLAAGDIPVLAIDRGGQVTYHGPGQLVMYLLLDIRRKGIGVRALVMALEQAIIDLLASYRIESRGDRDAPGVYVRNKKIAALGLRVSRGNTYHGLSLNINMDLSPFTCINPCGYVGLEVTQCIDLGIQTPIEALALQLCEYIQIQLGYSHSQIVTGFGHDFG